MWFAHLMPAYFPNHSPQRDSKFTCLLCTFTVSFENMHCCATARGTKICLALHQGVSLLFSTIGILDCAQKYANAMSPIFTFFWCQVWSKCKVPFPVLLTCGFTNENSGLQLLIPSWLQIRMTWARSGGNDHQQRCCIALPSAKSIPSNLFCSPNHIIWHYK